MFPTPCKTCKHSLFCLHHGICHGEPEDRHLITCLSCPAVAFRVSSSTYVLALCSVICRSIDRYRDTNPTNRCVLCDATQHVCSSFAPEASLLPLIKEHIGKAYEKVGGVIYLEAPGETFSDYVLHRAAAIRDKLSTMYSLYENDLQVTKADVPFHRWRRKKGFKLE